jgi:probable rRNA maturation factor
MEILVLNRQRGEKVPSGELREFAASLARSAGLSDAGFSVCLVSDRKMQTYNATYRSIRRPTDVLSFLDDAEDRSYLGDIVISAQTASRQAAEAKHSLRRELEILIVHGYLHLLGYDHETDDGDMMRLQRKLIRKYCHGE